jgi:elongation factor P
VEARSAQYLYNEGSNSVFIDTEKDVGELISVPTSILDELIVLMEPGSEVKILYCDDQMVDVMLPDKIRCTVESLAPSGGTKYAYARGVRFAVPTYVEVGEEVVISTETGEFVERAKGA